MSSSKRMILAGVVLLLLATLLAGCARRRSISDIMRDPARYANDTISIQGTVTRAYGALGTGVYEINDGTGKMWVFSESTGVPSEGARVTAQGRIMPTVTFAGRSYATVLRENRRRR